MESGRESYKLLSSMVHISRCNRQPGYWRREASRVYFLYGAVAKGGDSCALYEPQVTGELLVRSGPA